MYKLTFYVPEADVDSVKLALFNAGAGRVGNYDCCAWQVLGSGQFRPMDGSHPTIGQLNHVETVAEYRVEMVCEDQHIRAAISALKVTHPYETPAFDVIQLSELSEL